MKKHRIYITGGLSALAIMVMIGGMYLFPRHNRWWRRWWARLTIWLSGSQVKTEGTPDPNAQLFVINHRNILDIVLLEAVLNSQSNPCWIAKKEIEKIPLFGRILDVPRMLVIDRENSRELVKLIKAARAPLSEGRPLMIFPEGTRNKGNGLLPFKAGARMLAEKHQLTVQPVVIKGTSDRFDPKVGVTSGPVYLSYLPTVRPDEPGWYEALEKQMAECYTALPETT